MNGNKKAKFPTDAHLEQLRRWHSDLEISILRYELVLLAEQAYVPGEKFYLKTDAANQMVYVGKEGLYHRFESVTTPHADPYELMYEDLHLIERSTSN